VVSIRTSGRSGASYGDSMPVKLASWPARALAYRPFAAAKAVQEVAVRYLAVELGTRDITRHHATSRNITVNMVAGGWMDSDRTHDALVRDEARLSRKTALSRPYATEDEMADSSSSWRRRRHRASLARSSLPTEG